MATRAPRLELEGLGVLPREGRVREVAVLRGLAIDGVGEVELLDDDARPEVEVLADDLDELVGRLERGAVRLDEDGEGLRHADGVRQLHQAAPRQLRVHQRLGDPPREVRRGAVHLAVVFAGEGAAAVRAPAAVGVDDDFATGQTCVALGPADDELAGGLDLRVGSVWTGLCCRGSRGVAYVIDGAVVEVLGWDHLLDDLLLDLGAELLGGDFGGVLKGDDNGVDAEGDDGTAILLVLNSDLGLGIRSDPRKGAVEAGFLHRPVEFVCDLNGHWQHLGGLVGRIAKHDTLITGTELLEGLIVVQTLGDILRLLLNGDEDVAGLVVETLLGAVIANVFDGVTDDVLVVEAGVGGDFTKDHNHTGLGGGFAGDFGEGVLF